jgi:hypothetical protein
MQRGFMQRVCRKLGPDVWRFRWSETGPDGKRAHYKKVVGTVEQYADEHSARGAVVGLIAEINKDFRLPNFRTITVAELCDHFEQRELADQNKLAQPCNQEDLQSVLESLGAPSLAKVFAARGQDNPSRVLASHFAVGEKQLRQNPQFDVGAFQSCLPV